MTAPRDGFVIAAAIRHDLAERHGEWCGATAGYCRECGRTIFSQQFDGVCNATSCAADEEAVREANRIAWARAREAQRRRWPNGVGR